MATFPISPLAEHRSRSRFLRTTLAACLYLGSSLVSAGSPATNVNGLDQAISQGRVTSWNSLITQGSSLSELDKLQSVNRFINHAVSYGSDQDIWGEHEYWASPLETLNQGRGDCEDFAIAKFFSLTQMGIPNERLRLTYVKALGQNQAHMVLAYYPPGQADPLILDSLLTSIKPASQRRDLIPVYAFNHDGIYLAKAPQQKAKQSPDLLSRWTQVRERAVAEGSSRYAPDS